MLNRPTRTYAADEGARATRKPEAGNKRSESSIRPDRATIKAGGRENLGSKGVMARFC